MSYVWTDDNLPELGRTFLRNVLQNMRNYEGTTVKFGITGKGIKPNYQVTYPNGVKRNINGASHDEDKRTDEYDKEKISKEFSLAQIQKAYEQS